MPPDPRAETVLLSCEDGKPTFQRLIQLLKAVRGSRCVALPARSGSQEDSQPSVTRFPSASHTH